MLAIKIWNYLRGYVIIKVEGLTLERLLNLAATHNIYLWDVKRHSSIMLEIKTRIPGFKELKKIVKKTGCRIEIEDKVGLPFIFKKLRNRKMLAIGFLLFCIGVFLFTSTIWKIEILGNEQTPRAEIMSILEENDIKIGKNKYKIDKDEIKNILVNKFDYLSFVTSNIKGTVLTIEIQEQDLIPEKVDRTLPCNLVAKRKGVITKVTARNGRDLVKVGDVVEEGELLITGIIDNEVNEDIMLVHAEGEILALTRYSATVESSIVTKEEKHTGKTYKQRGLKIKDKGIKFMKGEIPFSNYQETIEEKNIINLEKYSLNFPIKVINYEYKEVEIREVKQNVDFLKKASHVNAIKEINKDLPKDGKIQSKNVIHEIVDNTLITNVIVEVLEDIGRKQIIGN